MKKILITSDSHQYLENFNDIVRCHKDADIKIHCGDSCVYKNDESLLGFLVVKGNHDFDDFPLTIVQPPFFIAHGHKHKIYKTTDLIIKDAIDNDCQIIFHGHTHIPYYKNMNGITVINPGSTMFNRGSYGYGTFAIGVLNDNNCIVDLQFYHHITHENVTEKVLLDGEKMLSEIRSEMIE